jgi:phosphoribosyl 1,2-cyclic phosphodiesterase
MPLTANVLLSHTHWDHIQGLPFFVPNFVPGNTLRLHGAFDPISGKRVEQAMAVQLQYSYFPVREAELKARIDYVTLMPEEPVRIGSATITPYMLNHPVTQPGLPHRGRRQIGVLYRRPRTPAKHLHARGDADHRRVSDLCRRQGAGHPAAPCRGSTC